MVAFKRLTFKDLKNEIKIKELDNVLRIFSLPQLRSILSNLKEECYISCEMAKYKATVIKYLRTGKNIESSRFLRKCTFQDLVMIPIEKAITDIEDFEWRGSWKATYYDVLPEEKQLKLRLWMKKTLDEENERISHLKHVAEYLEKYLEGKSGISADAFRDLHDAPKKAIETVCETVTARLSGIV